ncbi:DNA adenine methylase [Sphingomonas sp. SFZ2018-12]|uniref:DNA adenine methylase n=1 Tax=Sphingomonas sp. SFZ2018-12 TaxID=2683197 RepID=UPI001F0F10B1|nr:DNA adenine methylase [Sphingomonas sp. SFZ2018-12]
MTILARSGHPALRPGGREHSGNIMTESSPISAALQPPFNTSEIALSPIDPVLPVAPYIGGKRRLAKRIIARIAKVPHLTYAEVFVGMGGVFLRRDVRSQVEVINDWSEDVSTLFRILQRHYVLFLEMLRFQVTSRANFEKLLRQEPSSLTDLERAARFLYVQRLAFGGKVAGRHFGVSPVNSARFDVTRLQPMLEAIWERLAGVVIERMRWQDFLTRYDRPGTLFYLDPPYYGCENDYGQAMFDRAEFEQMAELLAGLKGRFLLSLNAHSEVRRIFAGFAIEEVQTSYSIGGNDRPKPVTELIISSRPT